MTNETSPHFKIFKEMVRKAITKETSAYVNIAIHKEYAACTYKTKEAVWIHFYQLAAVDEGGIVFSPQPPIQITDPQWLVNKGAPKIVMLGAKDFVISDSHAFCKKGIVFHYAKETEMDDWTFRGEVDPGNGFQGFGCSLAGTELGHVLVVGSLLHSRNGVVVIYNLIEHKFYRAQVLMPDTHRNIKKMRYGVSVAVAPNGLFIAVGAIGNTVKAGAYVYRYTGHESKPYLHLRNKDLSNFNKTPGHAAHNYPTKLHHLGKSVRVHNDGEISADSSAGIRLFFKANAQTIEYVGHKAI